jgi:ligand-binding sensor domain-containing protein
MRHFFLLLAGLFFCLLSDFAQPLGSWQEHLPYNNAIDLSTGQGKIYAATPFSCFSVSGAEPVIERLSRMTGLAETGVQTIFCTPDGTLVVAYQNSNIDLVKGGIAQTVNALKLKPITGDKHIYQVNGNDQQCLLSTGFGIVVLNLVKQEIGDSWVLGSGGAYLKINATIENGGFYYAATEDGLKTAPVAGFNLADYRNWTTVSGTAGLPAGPARQVILVQGTVFVQVGSGLYKLQNDQYLPFYADANNWSSVTSSADKILICQQSASGAALLTLSPDGTVQERLTHPLISVPKKALYAGASMWIADSLHGLLEKNDQGISAVIPNSPAALGSGGIIAKNQEWWVATGDAVSEFQGAVWGTYSSEEQTLPAGFKKAGPIVMDRSGDLWVGSDGGGLLKKTGDQFTLLREGLIAPSLDDPQAYRVGGLATDKDDNLWISNSGAVKGLVVRSPAGSSTAFTIPFDYNGFAVTQIVIDDFNQKWILSPNGNGLFCFNHGSSVENPADDQWRMYKAGRGNGNLPSNQVLSVVKDDFGFIWVGTADGIGIIQCVEQVFSSTACEAVLPVVQTDQFAGYLFKGEAVQSIAVDGANRKWIGTKNGVWLVSTGGEVTIVHFTTDNSPLLNNDVRNIAIDPVDGTVIFSTAAGLCAYKSDATGGGSSNSGVLVYPNPVPPGYTGQVAIRGLVNNAFVKITELNGRLVYQGRALGGQLVWNGHDLQGKPVASGVYLVIASDDSRKEQVVTKIVFIQR